MWTVRFDTDGNSLHRTHVDDANDTPDAKRMKLTHKQTLEKKNKCHDDTIDRDAGKKDSEEQKNNDPILLQPFQIKLNNPCQAS